MAWNEPGKSGQDPWGNSSNKGNSPKGEGPRKNQGGNRRPETDLEDLLNKLQKFMGGGKNGGNGGSTPFSGGIGAKGIGAIFLALVVIWGLTGIYIVDTGERGVITRFGAFTEETGPGPHWHLPYPIENVRKVKIDRIRTAEIGFRTDSQNRSGSILAESLMLTKDENIIDIRVAIQYRVQSASDYLFNVSNADEALRVASESAIRETVGKNSMDFVLTQGRNEVMSMVLSLTQENLDAYKTGLLITSVNLQDAQPPEQVQAAFADVVKAREDRERVINEAQAYSNKILPEARGKAARILEEAQGYHDQVIAQSEGRASRFDSVLVEYKKAPEVMRERLYLETMTGVLSNTSKVLLSSQNPNSLMYLPLDRMMGGSNQARVPFAPAEVNSNVGTTSQQVGGVASQQQTTNIRDYLRNRELR